MTKTTNKISVVTPTLRRPDEIEGLLANLSNQSLLPFEVILVDGAPPTEKATEHVVAGLVSSLPFHCIYVRHGGGTAIQRNVGIEAARGNFIAFIDDDVRLDPDFFETILLTYEEDEVHRVGGIAGYIANQHLDPNSSRRWRWFRRLRLFTTYEPGRYDYESGYPINRYLQPPHAGLKEIDFMGAGCAVWRREVFDNGLRFAEFFRDYGVLEDAHLALRAARHWILLECGMARCLHLHSQTARIDERRVAQKTAVNYRYVFIDIVPNRTWKQEFRFWLVQGVYLCSWLIHALQSPNRDNWLRVLGKLEGIITALTLNPECDRKSQPELATPYRE